MRAAFRWAAAGCAAAGAAAASADADEAGWRARKAALISGHPLYGRTIRQEDLAHLEAALAEADSLPASVRGPVAYLIQGEEDISSKEGAMWGASSDVYVLTFRTRRVDALFFPVSLLAEGRNALLLAALLQELRRGARYSYFALLDADVESTPAWTEALPVFEAFLRDWQPAVGLPTYGEPFGDRARGIDTSFAPQSIWHFDHIFVAVHWEAVRRLLPYDVHFDHTCAWVSQWAMSLLAGALFRDHVLMLPSVRVHNPTHSSYPKTNCMRQFAHASQRLRESAPQVVRSCLPDPPPPSVIRMPGPASLPNAAGGLQLGSYLPWGVARRKDDGASYVDYSTRTLSSVPSCDDEITAQALARPTSPGWSWCRGCTAPEAFWILQSMTAAHPRVATNWNSLGVWMKFIGEDESYGWEGRYSHFRLALACFAISQRLLQLARQPEDLSLASNLDMIGALLVEGGHSPDHQLWEPGGGNLKQAIRIVLRPQTDVEDIELLSEASLQAFADFLLSGNTTQTCAQKDFDCEGPKVNQAGAAAVSTARSL